MEFLESLEQEVNLQAENMAVEMILLLIDKWEEDLQKAFQRGEVSVRELLNHYVRLKISLHHVKRAWERGWSSMTESQFSSRANNLGFLIKEARRKYYVAKQRYEGEHDFGCACRGCRAIAEL